ncbi:RICIN domain-containing protein [Kitasatospora mediocidica]|uniref:hypothetical protein n=1 Tax=Kitasatospora mediocidica TaxID=58352 RepID=UPI00055F2322|nr:hypothetical protein [Kitasatospora mediocidica]
MERASSPWAPPPTPPPPRDPGPDLTAPATASQPPAVGSALAATPAAANVTYHTGAFTNNDKGQCLDGDTNTIGNNGAKVQLWACNGWSNQSWTWH